MSLHIVILAAGQGRRFYSKRPKVLHRLGGKPMLQRVVATAAALKPEAIHVIIGHQSDVIKEALTDLSVNWIEQTQQLGTGHAVMQAMPFIASTSQVLILSADVPLIQVNTLTSLLNQCYRQEKASYLGLLIANVPNPTGLGRIIRDGNQRVCAIVEEKDATASQRAIHEIYSGICCAKSKDLQRWLPQLTCNNAQEEYYLTDIIAKAVSEDSLIIEQEASNATEVAGVNNRLQLQALERFLQHQQCEQLMLSGVTLADATRVDVRGELTCGQDVYIDINTIFEGQVSLADDCIIGPNCYLNNVTVGAGSVIQANSILEHCTVGEQCNIGPFARLRPKTQVSNRCKIGNFVETKNAIFGACSKASHLSYLGDVTIGTDVNIGAGTITCNYDGAEKHQTIIENGAFIGSDTQLVAPVTVGENATIGAGSTIRKNAPPNELTLTETKQKTVYGWINPTRRNKDVS